MQLSDDRCNSMIRRIVGKHFEVNSWGMSNSELATFFRYMPISSLDNYPIGGIHMDAVVAYRGGLS